MRIAATAFAFLAAFAGAQAMAAGSPSVDDMIQQLKPTGKTMYGGQQGIHRGTGPIAGDTGATAAVARATASSSARAAAPDNAALPTLSLTVPFASGSADLLPAAIPTLRKLGAALKSPELADGRFRIEGHTDTVGTAEYNHELSERRAATVGDYLEKNFGVSAERLQMVGLGFDQPVVDTPPDTPEARNRRVQIVNLGG